MIGYLSGPITGHKDYRRQFAKAAAALKEMGYNVINLLRRLMTPFPSSA